MARKHPNRDRNPLRQLREHITVSKENTAIMVKVAVLGAAGGIGQPLSLLLKQSNLVSELALYDVVNSPGVAADLSHIATPTKVSGFLPKDKGLEQALRGAQLIVIPAGIPRKPGMTRDDLFKINAGIVRDLTTGIAEYAPKAFVLIISNPVNSTVPIAAEVLKKHKVFDATRLFGVTTLDVVRAQTFAAEILGTRPQKVSIPVIGGHSGDTIVPLLSQASPKLNLDQEQMEKLVNRIQFGGDEVVKAKDGAGSATLSMAYAGYRFSESVLRAIQGEAGVQEPAFVYLPGVQDGQEVRKAAGNIDFCAVMVELGSSGVKRVIPWGSISDYESKLLETAVNGLKGNIEKGVGFATQASDNSK